ncbi:MAG: MFS transporter [SAR202 cluster bacterium]|nr:MFS transporter [SAR202 cluster bacterium]
MFRLLIHPKFRLLFVNSMLGDMGNIAFFMTQGWVALLITDSPFWVGAVVGVQGLGLLLLGTIGGVMADRFERRNLVIGAQAVEAALALGIGALVLTDTVALWHLMVLGFLYGTANAVRIPSRNALIYDLVGKEQLLKGTAANYLAYQVVAIVGPLITGPILDNFVGWAYVFIGSAVSLAAVVLSFLRHERTRPEPPADGAEKRPSPLGDLLQGLSYGFRTPTIRALVVLALAVELFGWPHETMLPVMAEKVLRVGGTGYGYILAASGTGAILFTASLSRFGGSLSKVKLTLATAAAFGLFLILFGYSPWFGLSLLLIGVAYGMGFIYETMMSTLLQTAGPAHMRGRLLSFQSTIWGLSAVAGFYMGAIANATDARAAIAIGGGVLIVVSFFILPMVSRLRETPEGVR